MKRKFLKLLHEWKSHPLRKPLIVRGARQVGKTYVIEEFGNEAFENCLTINFEASPQFHGCFNELDPLLIIRQLELLAKQKIIPGKILLFLDEIQQCPKALQSLRYFYEKLPALHVIAAGSLLEFTIQDKNFSFPVGRIQFAKLYPFSFEEFLEAKGETELRQTLQAYTVKDSPPESIHDHLMKAVREYFIVGGMPSCITTYLKIPSFLEVKYAQQAIVKTYENDFGKYASQTQHRHLRRIFQEVPRMVGTHIKYKNIDPELPNPARDIKRAMELLQLAGILHPIFATSAGGVPLIAGLKETIFKLLFLDIGLIENILNIDPSHPDLMKGGIAEQFVGQEFLANADPQLDFPLFFWSRSGGTAEVDYLWVEGKYVIPIEVKAGKSGKFRSLKLFLEEKKSPFGVTISEHPLHFSDRILYLPFYLISQLPRMVKNLLH